MELPTNDPVFIACFMFRLKLYTGSNLTFLMDFKGTKLMLRFFVKVSRKLAGIYTSIRKHVFSLQSRNNINPNVNAMKRHYE